MGADLHAGIRLRRTAQRRAEIDALADRWGGRVELSDLLADQNRRARRSWAPGRSVRGALTWDAADRRDPHWWPQGITSSADADPSGTVHGRRLVVVSWYSKRQQGARVTVVDLETRRYRHVLLVEPTVDSDLPAVKPLQVHAGGLAWHGPYLHVAATAKGVAVCHVDDLLRVPEHDAAGVETFGYRYLLPVRFWYAAETHEGAERFRYSFLSLARTPQGLQLVAGEYGNSRQTRRLSRFRIGEDHLLATGPDGTAEPLAVHDGGPLRMQGAVWVDGTWHTTTSHGPWTPGSVWSGAPGTMTRRRWAVPMGPEDLAMGSGNGLWTVTEHPNRRWVLVVQRPEVGP